jgi:hypothetical protein
VQDAGQRMQRKAGDFVTGNRPKRGSQEAHAGAVMLEDEERVVIFLERGAVTDADEETAHFRHPKSRRFQGPRKRYSRMLT